MIGSCLIKKKLWVQIWPLNDIIIAWKGMTSYLLAMPIGKRLCICARFGLGDKILAHSLPMWR